MATADEGASKPQPTTTPAVVVVGTESAAAFESTADATGFVEVIDAAEAWRGYETVAEILRERVGVQIHRTGGREDRSTISVRGSTAGQVKVLLDGVSLSSASDVAVDLADIPLDAVERIEVYRGFTPLAVGGGGAASAVNIITKTPTAASAATSLSYGSFDSFKATVHAAAPRGKAIVSAFATYRRTDGDFEFNDGNGTPENPFDDRRRRRRNNDHESVDLLLRYDLPLTGGRRLKLTSDTYYKEEGAPGRGEEEALFARFERTRAILAGSYHGDVSEGSPHAGIDLTIDDRTLRDPGTSLPPVTENLIIAGTLRAGRTWPWRRRHHLQVELESTFEHFEGDFPDAASSTARNQQRYRLAVGLGDEIYFPRLRLTLAPQLRTDLLWNDVDVSNPQTPMTSGRRKRQTSVDPRVGARVDVAPWLTFQANASTYFRAPLFAELFGSDGFSIGNPDLEAEQGKSADAGLRVRIPRWRALARGTLEYAWFLNDVDNQIVFIGSGARVPKPENIGRTRTRGHELRAELASDAGPALSANYTKQVAENRSPTPSFRGMRVPSQPDHDLAVSAGMVRPRWSIDYELRYRSNVFLSQFNLESQKAEGYVTHSATIGLRPFVDHDLELRLEASNLGDELSQDLEGFPAPGRAFYVTLSYAPRADDDSPVHR